MEENLDRKLWPKTMAGNCTGKQAQNTNARKQMPDRKTHPANNARKPVPRKPVAEKRAGKTCRKNVPEKGARKLYVPENCAGPCAMECAPVRSVPGNVPGNVPGDSPVVWVCLLIVPTNSGVPATCAD